MPLSVVEYQRQNGSNPYREWFLGLSVPAATKVSTAVARIELGNTANIKWFDGIGEYRIDWGPGYRIYLAMDGARVVILLGGGTKKRQQVDIERAKVLWSEYKARKKGK